MSHLYGISPQDIDQFWPKVESYVRAPLERTGAIKDIHPEDVLEAIKESDMQCWVEHDDGEIIGAVITQVLVYPQRKVLGVPFAGAVNGTMPEWVGHFEILKEFAKAQDCGAVRVWGRKGWEKVLNPDESRVEIDIEV
jgi:hypothetical protein